MTLDIFGSEQELYRFYTNQLREQSRIAISISDTSDEDRIQIENGLQEMLTAEVIKLAHDELRARGVSNEFLDERGFRSSLEGLPLPGRDHSILEAKVRQLARSMMLPRDGGDGGIDGGDGEDPGDGPQRRPHKRPSWGTIKQASHQSGHVCICMTTGIPGTTQSLSGVNPLPSPPPGQNSVTIAVFLSVNTVFGRQFSGDSLRLVVEPGAQFGVGPGQMLVGLATTVNWAKEIYAWNLCRGKLASVHQSGPNTTPTFMLLTRGCDGADTIIFTKPQTFGVWADVGNFDFTLFWTVFGGRRLTFTWITD